GTYESYSDICKCHAACCCQCSFRTSKKLTSERQGIPDGGAGTRTDSRRCREQSKPHQTRTTRTRDRLQALRLSLRYVPWQGRRRQGRVGTGNETGSSRL